MLTKEIFEEIGSDLRTLGQQIQGTTFEDCRSLSIPFDAIRLRKPFDHLDELDVWVKGRGKAQYIYRLTVSGQVDVSQLRSAFDAAKKENVEGRAYARLQQVSGTLYVGSSQSLISRIKQHLGLGSTGTYALQMSYWLPDVEGSLHIEAWRFGEDTTAAVVQAIEDGLWAITEPMFGRRGAK